ncbi:hypothetical protein [Adlercreutzia sp. ZJ473]|uniref:hypothetical protein n=1 Tax=Adlercreutzia sp. ZJ473 TaxID=2722822 RepID=UPI001553B545|nr:hypothetical protein [Adlercreutzia sp. ZJ473]
MGRDLMPLHYAIVKHFEGGAEDCAEGVVHALAEDYGSYKLLTRPDVEEALATAKENGLLDETRCDLDEGGELRIYYRVSDFGADMMRRYLGR